MSTNLRVQVIREDISLFLFGAVCYGHGTTNGLIEVILHVLSFYE